MKTKLDTQLADELWQEYYARHGRGWLNVISGSMMPLIHIGDRVLVSSVLPADIRPGDVIAFRRDNVHIVHRVMKRLRTPEGLLFIERGDANGTRRTFREQDVIGQIIAIKRDTVHYKLDSFAARTAGRTLAWWFWHAIPVISRLYDPSHNILKYPGRFVSLPLRAGTKALIHSGRCICYLSALGRAFS